MIRAGLVYAACWLLFGALYSVILYLGGRPIAVADALTGGMTNSLYAALLGIPVLLVVRRGLDRGWSRGRLTATGGAAALLFAAAWTTLVSLSVVVFAPPEASAMYLRWGLWWQFVTGLFLGSAIVAVPVFLHNARRLREQQARAAHAEALRARAELAALRAQLQPHFLFNALHSISAVLRSNPRGAEEALEQLGAMLRYALGVQRDDREEVTLAEELEFVRAYLAIEQLRLGERLKIEERVDPEALECAVLAFTIQPLVENAVRHGIAANPGGGTVRIEATVDDDRLTIVVADNGMGATESVHNQRASRGVGIRSVQQRLSTRYGPAAALRIDTAEGHGFSASITLPVIAPQRRVLMPPPPPPPPPVMLPSSP